MSQCIWRCLGSGRLYSKYAVASHFPSNLTCHSQDHLSSLGYQIPTPPTPTEPQYPLVLDATAFTLEELVSFRRIRVSTTDISKYRRNTDLLTKHTFVTSAPDGSEKAFRVSTVLTGGEKLVYVVFADDGPEAVSYSLKDFFDLLSTSKRAVLPSKRAVVR